MAEYKLYIDGKFVEPKNGRYDVTLNPFDGSSVAKFAVASAEDVDEAVKAARRASDSGVWSELSPEVRGGYLRKIGEQISALANELVELEVLTRAQR